MGWPLRGIPWLALVGPTVIQGANCRLYLKTIVKEKSVAEAAFRGVFPVLSKYTIES